MRLGTRLRLETVRPLFKLIPDKTKQEIYDMGGFDGIIAYELKRKRPKANITVVDLDKNGLRKAKGKGLNIIHSSILSLPIRNSSADWVLALDIIEHIKEDNLAIKEISRVLKRGGKLILSTPKENGVVFPLISKKKSEKINKGWGHIRPGYKLEELEKILKENGLKILVTTTYFAYFTRLAYLLLVLPKPLSFFSFPLFLIAIKLERIYKLDPNEHLIVAEKCQKK
jgi:ubiquinone/menaquinone biosynthesis C-methylase UbiE